MITSGSRIRASIVGSLPKPTWLADPEVLYAPWRQSGAALAEAQDDAVRLWVDQQERSGLDIFTDGEQKRRHYIWGFLEGLEGFDTENLAVKASRGRRYSEATPVARCIGNIAWERPVIAPHVAFLRSLTKRQIKVTLPGPMTTADSVLDECCGRSNADFAMAYAALLNAEAKACVEAGADIVQIDEPCFNIYMDEMRDWGIEALEKAFSGVKVSRAVHICYGYGVEIVRQWKEKNTDWSHYFVSLPLLAESSIDQISIETAGSGVSLACLECTGDKEVLLGVVSSAPGPCETPEIVAKRIHSALAYLPPERLIACTDCGLVALPRSLAISKMAALSRGTRLVNGSVENGTI
jgi:5-methyltetrahydropteroyltriglutamate--homocysteine methyltransferase